SKPYGNGQRPDLQLPSKRCGAAPVVWPGCLVLKRQTWNQGGRSLMNIRQAEFDAIVNAFLGADYDPERRKQIEDLQLALRQRQAELFRRHGQAAMTDDAYVDETNAAIDETFRKCEEILGPEDFRKL